MHASLHPPVRQPANDPPITQRCAASPTEMQLESGSGSHVVSGQWSVARARCAAFSGDLVLIGGILLTSEQNSNKTVEEEVAEMPTLSLPPCSGGTEAVFENHRD